MKELFAIPELLTLDGQSVTDAQSLSLLAEGPNTCGNGCDNGCHGGSGSCWEENCPPIIE
jgi:hypothetical protein